MASNNTFQIASHFTNVDLAQGLTTNLSEIELALKLNPGEFTNLTLLDQAKGSTFKNTAFPTAWDGSKDYFSDGFGQDIWRTTGLGFLQPSNLSQSLSQTTLNFAKSAKRSYASYLTYLLNSTGSSHSIKDPNLSSTWHGSWGKDMTRIYSLPEFNLGISTEFDILDEVQTGSPDAVDLLLNQSNSGKYFESNPHAYFISNHGGSYMWGGNGDGPDDDLDLNYRPLEVKEFANSIESAIQTYAPKKARLGLIAFDECQMASIETLTQLSQSTRYLLASQRNVPGNGFDYLLTLSDFKNTAPLSSQEGIEANAKALGTAFVDTYSARNGDMETLSLTDTNGVKALNTAIKSYADALIASSDDFIISLLKAIRLKGTKYGYEHMQDLGNVAAISKNSINASNALVEASEDILANLNKVVVTNNHSYNPLQGYQQGLSSGLAITLPTAITQWQNHDTDLFKSKAPGFEAATGWSRVIDKLLPVLSKVEANSGFEEINLNTANAEVNRESGSEAYLALKIDGYLTQTSNDSAINATRLELPELDNTLIGELELYFNVLNLNQSGTAIFSLRDANNKEKASWKRTIDEADVFTLFGADLEASVQELSVEAGDSLVITPDSTIGARYDLDLVAQNQKLSSFSDEWDEENEDNPLSQPSLFNFSLDADDNQLIYYHTPVSPFNAPYQTDIVLLSSNEGINSLTIENLENGKSKTFSSTSFVEESIQLESNTKYEFEIEFNEDATSSSAASDIALLINHQGRPTTTITDAIISKNIELGSWGTIDINIDLTGIFNIVDMHTDIQIDGFHSLEEGRSVNAKFGSQTIDKNSIIQDKYSGGTETFFSGLWTSDKSLTLTSEIEGTSAKPASFGFFKVDDLTGAIQTSTGLIQPSQNNSYKTAVLDNLISPLAELKNVNKSGTVEVDIEANTAFGAVLLTKGHDGKEIALYSIASANPNQGVQFLNFGDGYYGIEDRVMGQDGGHSGDYNDITFHMS